MMARTRRTTARLVAVVMALPFALAGCLWPSGEVGVGSVDGVANTAPTIGAGTGSFVFDDYPPLRDRPVRVWYYAPEDPAQRATAEIIVVMHGVGRNGEEYRAAWMPYVRDRNVILLVPEFSEQHYPGSANYNLGGILGDDGQPTPEESWSFNIIGALFDFVVEDTGSNATQYNMFGHSAGAQFVHRFVEFVPNNRIRTAVAANAGWYTVIDNDVEFPYGLEGVPGGENDMKRTFATRLHILLGADDIDADDDSLRHDKGSDAQGLTRLARGINFYTTARDAAADQSFPFNWRLSVVPHIGHSYENMARVAAPMLLDTPHE